MGYPYPIFCLCAFLGPKEYIFSFFADLMLGPLADGGERCSEILALFARIPQVFYITIWYSIV